MSKIIVIGVGNEYRGDDGVGIFISKRIITRKIQGVQVCEEKGDEFNLIELWRGFELAIVIDAICAVGTVPTGQIFRFNAHEESISDKFFRCSTHVFSLADAVRLAQALGRLPKQLIIYGIAGENFREQIGLSRDVVKAAHDVENQILRDIQMLADSQKLLVRL